MVLSKRSRFIAILARACLCVPCLCVAGIPPRASADVGEPAGAALIEPQRGDTIEVPHEFPVSLEIAGFEEGSRYWVAVATVDMPSGTWARTRELRTAVLEGGDAAAKNELLAALSRWKPKHFWPKFEVDASPFEAPIYEGGKHPLKPWPLIVLLLEVDDALHEQFQEWFVVGEFKGIPASALGRDMVLARSEIFIP